MPIAYALNPRLRNEDLNPLYDAAWPAHAGFDFDPVLASSLAYVCAYDASRLVGFVYLAWDGAQHAFLLEPTVHPDYQRRGIGTRLVQHATSAAREAGCEVLHVDYEEHLTPFYTACGFSPSPAGVIRL